MAEENLGTAVLRIVVDDEPARNALNLLKRDVEATTQQATRARRTVARPPTPRGGARESTDAVERANQRIIGIQNRINLLEAKGVDITQARARLSQAIAANEQRNFGSVKQITSRLSNTLKIEEGRLRVSAAQTAELKRQNTETKSVASTEKTRAQKPTGVGFATTPEQILAGRGGTQKGAANSINTINTALDKAVQLRNRLNVLDAKGADVSKLRAIYEQANAANTQSQFGTSQRLLQNLARQVSLAENDLRVANLREAAAKRRLKTASDTAAVDAKGQPPPPPGLPPVGVVPALPKGYFAQQTREAEKQAKEAQAASRRQQAATAAEAKSRRQNLQGRISSGLIGGAFPLLFGQGPGAALGGLAGGVAGGGAFGFGASLVGTGIGASFDALIARSRELAEALRDPIAAFDQLKTTSALSSRGLETYIEALIKSGQTAAAEQLIRADLTRTLNPTTAAALSQANDELARSFSDVQEKLAAITAGPAIAFLQWLDDIVDRLPIQGPAGAEPGQLPTAEQGRSQANRGRLGQVAGIGLIAAAAFLGSLALPGPGTVAGAGLAATLVGGAGVGALAGGTAANAAGERVPEDLATQQRTAGIQKEIEATQARRITLQKQLIGFTGNEASGAAQLAQTQQVVLAAQQASLEALKTLTSLPQDASIDERIEAEKAYKEAVAASLIEVEKLIAANNNQARNLKRATDLRERTTGFSSSGRQGAVLTDAVVKAREDYDKAKAALEVTSIAGLEAARSDVNKFGQQWRSATQDLADYNAELRITAQLDTAQTSLALQGIGQQIAATQALGKAERGVARDTLATTQAIQAGINEAKRREQEIGAQIDAARQRGDESGAASLVNQQKIAANETRLELEKGALALTEAGEQLRDSLRNAIVDFTRIRSDPQGLNRFLNPQQQQERAQRDFQLLLPQFRQAQSRFTQLTGANAPEFTGSAAGVNESIRDFINATQTESQATKDLAGTQQALATNLEAYNSTLVQLASVTQTLADKNWAVNVAVSGAQSAISGDVLNGAVSP